MTTETLHDRIQAGYLLIKLAAEAIITPAEMRTALATLFPDILPARPGEKVAIP